MLHNYTGHQSRLAPCFMHDQPKQECICWIIVNKEVQSFRALGETAAKSPCQPTPIHGYLLRKALIFLFGEK